MEELLKTVFLAEKVYDSGTETFSLSKERFFLIGGSPRMWVAIMEGDSLPSRSYNHVAFKIPDEQFDDYRERVLELGLEMRVGRTRVAGEGRSIYFYDHDNHMFELQTGTLEERLRRYVGTESLSHEIER